MNKKLMLTSIVAIAFAMPAMAEPQNTSATFPADDYMQEDTTYTGQATYGNMGVYEGEVTAQAEYEDILYNIAAGQYLPAASTSGAQCTAGNFCTGLTGATYNENSAQGLTACSTLESGAYPNSVAGASANTDCYRACTTQNANIAHATAVSGNDYYGAGTDTCIPTACESGYHVLNFEYLSKHQSFQNYSFDDSYRVHSIQYDNGVTVTYQVIWSSHTGTVPTMVDNLVDEWGQTGACYVYGRIVSYTLPNGVTQNITMPWLLLLNDNFCEVQDKPGIGMPESQDEDLAMSDDIMIQELATCRSTDFCTLYDSYINGLFAICEANTITINWSDATAADISANNAGQCTYGGDVRTPAAATDKTNIGKRFKGWKFVKPNNNQ